MPHRNVGHFFYNIFPSCSNCSSSEAETRNPMHIHQPLGFARGALGFARGALGFARGATPRLRSGGNARLRSGCNARLRSGCTRLCSGCNPRVCLGCNPSASLGVQSKRNSHCPGKCSFYPNIFTHSPTCVHMKSASGTSV